METRQLSRDGEAEFGIEERETERLTITPHPLRSSPPAETIQSPETPHPSHGRQLSESRQLLPQSSHSKSLFQYSSTTAIEFGDVELIEQSPWPRWSADPQTLRRRRREVWSSAIVDLGVLGVVLLFFVLAAAIIRVDGKAPEGRQAVILRECAYVAATLFPLVFSLVLGRLAVKVASFSLERGSTLGLLERLMGSRTFFSTISTQIQLWPLNVLAICLILVWLLSPFGSQAILRSLTVEYISTTEKSNITYFNSRQATDLVGLEDSFVSFSTLFTASLLAASSTKNGSQDLWGNIKIPDLSSFSNNSALDDQGWLTFPSNFTPAYTSLFGIPTSSPSKEGNTTFTVEASYLSLSCQNITSNLTRDIENLDPKLASALNSKFINPGLISPSGPFISSSNITSTTRWALGYLGHDVTSFLPEGMNTTFTLDALTNSSQEEHFPGLLLFQDFTGLQNVTSIYCVPSQIYVENEISCAEGECEVTKQRPSTLAHAPPALTYLSFASVFQELSELLPLATPQNQLQEEDNPREGVDILLNYLSNPNDNTFIQSATSAGEAREESRFLGVPLADFGERLGMVLNAFIQGGMSNATTYLTGSAIPTSEKNSAEEMIKARDGSITVPTDLLTTNELFTVHWPWLSIYLLSTTILLLSALTIPILTRLTISRPYLGYVSSLCRESPACGLPPGGVKLSGLERTRRLRDVKVRLGDVGDIRDGFQIGIGAALSVGRLGVGLVGGRGRLEVVRGLDSRKLYI